MSDGTPTVGEQLAVINVKLDLLLVGKDDHETRLRTLEKFRWVLLGAALSAGPIWSQLAPHLA